MGFIIFLIWFAIGFKSFLMLFSDEDVTVGMLPMGFTFALLGPLGFIPCIFIKYDRKVLFKAKKQ